MSANLPERFDIYFHKRLSKDTTSDFNSHTDIVGVALITFVTCDIFSRKLLLHNSCLIILLNRVMKLLKSLTNIRFYFPLVDSNLCLCAISSISLVLSHITQYNTIHVSNRHRYRQLQTHTVTDTL